MSPLCPNQKSKLSYYNPLWRRNAARIKAELGEICLNQTAPMIVIASKAKQSSSDGGTGLLRFARNDDSD